MRGDRRERDDGRGAPPKSTALVIASAMAGDSAACGAASNDFEEQVVKRTGSGRRRQ